MSTPRCAQRGCQTAKACDAKSIRRKQFLIILKQIRMKTTKMSLANIQGKLSRTEMKNIMAGSGSGALKCRDGCVPKIGGSGCPTDCECKNKVGSGNIWNCGGY